MSASNQPTVLISNTNNGQKPSDSRTYSFSLTLSPGVTQLIDLRTLQNLNLVKAVQGLWLDNSDGSASCSVSMGVNQDLIIPASYQATMPAFVNYTNPIFAFSGNGTVQITLTNFPLPAAVWPTEVASGGTQIVSDPALEALISNGAFQASEALYGPGDAIIHGRAGTLYSGSITAAGTTTLIAGAPNCFVTDFHIYADADFIQNMTTSATLDIAAKFENGETFFETTFPASAAPVVFSSNFCIEMLNLGGVNAIGDISGDNLIITVGTLWDGTGGPIRYTVFGGPTGLT